MSDTEDVRTPEQPREMDQEPPATPIKNPPTLELDDLVSGFKAHMQSVHDSHADMLSRIESLTVQRTEKLESVKRLNNRLLRALAEAQELAEELVR
jgi:hypothetical protein